MKTVTREWLEEFKTVRGGWRNAQLVQLGEPWPPKRGWIDRNVGKQISDEAARLFEHYSTHRTKGKERKQLRLDHGRKKSSQPSQKSSPVKIYRAPKEPPSSRRITHIRGIDVRSTEFLSTYEWRSLRVKVLAKYGARCMCCGASPANGAVMHVDHIKPRKLFPALALDEENLQVLCEACNHGKGNWDQTDWRPAEDNSESDAVSFLRSIMYEK